MTPRFRLIDESCHSGAAPERGHCLSEDRQGQWGSDVDVASHQGELIPHDGRHSTVELVNGDGNGGKGEQDSGRAAVDTVRRWRQHTVIECRRDTLP